MSLLAQAVLVFICTALAAAPISAQTNLLLNPNADSGADNWRLVGETSIEEFDGEKVFVIREQANDRISGFHQDVNLDKSDVGRYALLIGRGSSERINPDGAITGLPHLYGYMLASKQYRGAVINEYLQGQMMRARATVPNAWVTMYGIFRIPERTIGIQFMLGQSSRRGVPPNGSAARFDDLGLYLFDTREAAMQFVKSLEN